LVEPVYEHGGQQKFFQVGCKVDVLLILAILTMKCKCPFMKRFTLSARLHHKENTTCYNNSHKKYAFMTATVSYDNFHDRLSADFQSRVLIFTEVLP